MEAEMIRRGGFPRWESCARFLFPLPLRLKVKEEEHWRNPNPFGGPSESINIRDYAGRAARSRELDTLLN